MRIAWNRARLAPFIAAAWCFVAGAAPARADVVARIDVASQSLTLIVDGVVEAVWPVSTARRGYHTPRGAFRPIALKRVHYSSKYDDAPMPFSIFFKGGYAVHGTTYVRQLGRPASHGCIRLSTPNAAALFELVREQGLRNTRIIIG
jgi:lipoprotein-anchoring transpeptidase ErfK/SrfK